MGLSFAEAMSAIQMNLGWETTKEDIDYGLEVLSEAVARVRAMVGHDPMPDQP